ncbi:hypothetical protein D3C79_785130 [compost metagenome]
MRQTIGDSGMSGEVHTTWKSCCLTCPLCAALARMRSATAAASTLRFSTARMLASWDPEKITREKSVLGSWPACSRPALGNRCPEAELGSTKANVLPCRSCRLRMPLSLRAMIRL